MTFDERVLRRIVRFTIALGLIGGAAAWLRFGPRVAGGFLCGASISILNFWTLERMTFALTSSGTARGSTALFGLRYFLVGGAVYVIVKILEISLMSVLAGLFVSAAAVILEILYELVFL
jgi:hypothetical protein